VSQPLGLYLHIPFCSSICAYCNFNRGLLDPELKRQYVDALALDVARLGDATAADTVYFGGGTPSLLEPAEIARLVEACHAAFAVAGDAEITLEVNPETVDVPRFRDFQQAGVNRISLGVQSFRDEELRRLGRVHDVARAVRAYEDIRRAGFDNVSLDLMMWLPEQRLAEWLLSIDTLVALEPDHVSMYLLELYPNAPLREDMARAAWSQAPDDEAADMYLTGLSRLDAAGYAQYEISNVCRGGRVARHNLKYWTDGEWLAFGCGAHGTRNGIRWKNISATGDYVAAIRRGDRPVADERQLSPQERVGDALITGLRLTNGIEMDVIDQRYGVDVWAMHEHALAPYLDAGVLIEEQGRLRLTREGMLIANEILAVFV
jgi:oxygen-independent coproporphyrinogen-3 oxidase